MSSMKRLILHWTGGSHTASTHDKECYHMIVEGDGDVVKGKFAISDNVDISDGVYAAHTYHLNTGSIGISMAAMGGAKEAPFICGVWPITEAQLSAFCALAAGLCVEYGIQITRETVLTHAEVQPTLKVAQKQKWDITWLPGMTKPGDPIEVGDMLRSRIASISTSAAYPAATKAPELRIMRKGDVGSAVEFLQQKLRQSGAIGLISDGDFGDRTQAAVRFLQSKAGLKVDGIVGPATWAALMKG